MINFLMYALVVVSVNWILFTISYLISKYSSDPWTSDDWNDTNTPPLVLIIGVVGALALPIVICNSFFTNKGLQTIFQKLDYYFDPKMKGKRILDKQIEEFKKSTQRNL